MENHQYFFKNFKLVSLMFPSRSLCDNDFLLIHKDILRINISSGLNLDYGVYSSTKNIEEIKQIYSKMIVIILYKDNKPIASSFAHCLGKINEKPCVHSGLVIISENPGENILFLFECLKTKILQNYLGFYYITTITTIPKVVSSFCYGYTNVWPSPSSNLMFPIKEYKSVLDLLETNYIRTHFPSPEKIKINKRRFILQTDKREAGFKETFHELSKAKKLNYNLFCQCWINYDNNEDLILIGKSQWKSKLVYSLVLSYFKIKLGIRKNNFNISSLVVEKTNATINLIS